MKIISVKYLHFFDFFGRVPKQTKRRDAKKEKLI